jgi:hypothetical protein
VPPTRAWTLFLTETWVERIPEFRGSEMASLAITPGTHHIEVVVSGAAELRIKQTARRIFSN